MNKRINIILLVSLLLCISFLISNLIYIFTLNTLGSIRSIFQTISLFIVLVFLILVTILFYKQNYQLQNEKEHNEALNKTCDELNSYKHDFNNMLQALEGHIVNNDLNGAKTYLKSIMKESKNIDNISSIKAEDVNNIAVYNLIAKKYFKALEHNINFNIELLDDLNQDSINNFNFCRILGILLDNAIEASNQCFQNKHIILSVFKNENKNCKSIILQNTFADKKIDIGKIFEKSYSTKPGNTGIGLWKVKNILKRNFTVHLTTNICDGYFIQTLDLY